MKRVELIMPRVTSNDDFVTLACWCVENGSFVKKGQTVAILETTKETKDLIAEEDGYISYNTSEGMELAVGNVVAEIYEELVKIEKNDENVNITGNVSKKALKLIEKYNIDISNFSKNKIIKEKDVLKLINESTIPKQSVANNILIVCGGNTARMCIDTLRIMGGYRIGGFTDIYAKPGSMLMGVPCIGDIDMLGEKYREGHRTAVNACGGVTNTISDELFFARKRIYEEIKGYQYFMPNLIHPNASIESSVTMGEGNLIFSGAYVGSEAVLGNDCVVNTGAIVSHNCVLGDHCRISPGAILAGNVFVGENSIIGMGVTIYMKVRIGKNVIIYNGKNIFNDVPDNSVVK